MRIEQLTFTRFIAAISIVIFHYGGDSFLFNNKYLSFIFKQANIGVSYFFILSGFVMTIAYWNRSDFSMRQYLINRLARIYPLYLFALILYLASSLFTGSNITTVLLNIAMLQSWFPDMALTLNSPGWSISVEFFFYLTFPILLSTLKQQNFKYVAVVLILFWITSQVIYTLLINQTIPLSIYQTKDIYYLPLLHLNEFLVGILTGIYYLKQKQGHSLKTPNSGLIAIMLVLIILALKFPLGLSYHNGLLALLFAPLIYLISINQTKIAHLFSKRAFVYLGEISFGIYLLQAPVWRIASDYRLEKYLGIQKSINGDDTHLFLIKLFILLLSSAITFHLIENPLRQKIRNWMS